MDLIDLIMNRRSIRKYQSKSIPDELMTKLLRAAMQAPSAHNMQPWNFVVITDHEQLTTIAGIHPYAEMLNEAPAAIAVCGDRLLESDEGYLALDCAAATQNILLGATALGLGAVWIGIFPRSERISALQKLLDLPENILPVSLVAVGYPHEKKRPVDRFQTDRIFHNKYGNLRST
jgi:nitroreductase